MDYVICGKNDVLYAHRKVNQVDLIIIQYIWNVNVLFLLFWKIIQQTQTLLYNPINMITFAERLKTLREKRGLMQKAVAADLNIGNTTLSNYEQNVSSPNPEILVSIADYFDTSVDYLLGRTDNPAPHTNNLSETETDMVHLYRSLDDEGKRELADYAAFLAYKKNKK